MPLSLVSSQQLSGDDMTREDAENLFDLMEAYREENPGATDDECYEIACRWNIDRTAARMDALKEQRREQYPQ